MKSHVMKLTTLLILLVPILALAVIAASPLQTGEPPAPVSLVDQIVGVIILALGSAVAWLVQQVRTLKKQAVAAVEEKTPEQWHWLWAALATTFVKAAAQILKEADGPVRLAYAESMMYAAFEQYGFVVDDVRKKQIRAIVEAAYYDLKNEIGPTLISIPDHK